MISLDQYLELLPFLILLFFGARAKSALGQKVFGSPSDMLSSVKACGVPNLGLRRKQRRL